MASRERPLESLSPDYRKRIESALKRGLSRSQARGHARVDRGELPAKLLRDLTKKSPHDTVLLRRVIASGDVMQRVLYAQAYKEGFRKSAPWSMEGPTAVDELLTWRRGSYLLEDDEFTEYPGEAFTNVEDINVFEGVLDRLSQFEMTEDLEDRIAEIKDQLERQKRDLKRRHKVYPKRWGKGPTDKLESQRSKGLPKKKRKNSSRKKSVKKSKK